MDMLLQYVDQLRGGLYTPPLALMVGFVGAVLALCGLGWVAMGPLLARPGIVGVANVVGVGVNGLVVGLAFGLIGSLSLGYFQTRAGVVFFSFTLGLLPGLLLGGGVGALGGFAVGRARRLPAGSALGALVGLIVALAAFILIFGRNAGYGAELDNGVGPEIGMLFGLVGAMLGALLGRLVALRIQHNTSASQTTAEGTDTPLVDSSTSAKRRSYIRWGVLIGGGSGLVIALIGWLTNIFTFILPYYGYIPDYGQPTGPLYTALGVLYGLAIFALCGSLLGALAGALITRSSPMQRAGSDTPSGAIAQWRWLTLAPALLFGLYAGLSLGFLHGDVGGPFITGRPVLPYDPAGTALGIGLGALAGALFGLGCAWLMAWAEQRPQRRARLYGLALTALCLVVALTPMWFSPLFGVSIP